jgi:glucose/arabinose dehydrogenase
MGFLLDRGRVWGGLIFSMGTITLLLIFISSLDTSFDSPWSLFDFNPLRLAKRVWKTSDYTPVVVGVLVGTAIPLTAVVGTVAVLYRNIRWRVPALVAVIGISLAGLFVGAASVSSGAAVPSQDISSSLKVPPGFSIRSYLPQGLLNPTSIAFDSNDKLYVATLNGEVHIVEDTNGDGSGDKLELFSRKNGLALGIAIGDDDQYVYVSGGGEVIRYRDMDRDGKSDESDTIIDGLPTFVYDAHSNNGLVIGPDGLLYMTLGGISDHGPDNDPLAGSILVANSDGSDLRVFASRLRNPYDLAFTSTGLLIATDNGPDQLDERLPWAPPDELNVIQEGRDYGYPDYFGFPPPWSDSSAPAIEFLRHSVPTGTVAYQGVEFPAEFFDQIFVATFGLRFSKVVAVTLSELQTGIYRGVSEDFATGFSSAIDVTVDSQGRLYIADYGGNQVYQVSWVGDDGDQGS